MPNIDRKSLRSYEPSEHVKKIPVAVKEQVWVQNLGKVFEATCHISWCDNTITPFSYHVGHDIPRSKGGTVALSNLFPICDRCNFSMGNKYSIRKWDKLVSR
jgi:5-methylcytosine-specific restriction endonuclease McrA